MIILWRSLKSSLHLTIMIFMYLKVFINTWEPHLYWRRGGDSEQPASSSLIYLCLPQVSLDLVVGLLRESSVR